MTEPEHDPPARSVAEEAALLIGLLSAGLSDGEARAAGARASARSRPGACEACGHDPHADPEPSREVSVCRVCPVCQLIAFVKAVSPDAIERLADVVDMLGDGLRVFAQSRRGGTSSARPSWSPAPGFPGGARPTAGPSGPGFGQPAGAASPAHSNGHGEPGADERVGPRSRAGGNGWPDAAELVDRLSRVGGNGWPDAAEQADPQSPAGGKGQRDPHEDMGAQVDSEAPEAGLGEQHGDPSWREPAS